MAVIEWIFFCVGPLWNNAREIDFREGLLKKQLIENDISFNDHDFNDARHNALISFAPNTLETMAWHFVKPDDSLYYRIIRNMDSTYRALRADRRRGLFNLNPGSLRVIHSLSRTYQLGIADNDFQTARFLLDEAGLLPVFALTDHFGRNPFSKPDARFYEYLLQKTEIHPEKAIIVGTRLDLDLVPALMLGMKTILIKRGIYTKLEPRNPAEYPHLEIVSIKSLPEAVKTLEIVSDS